MPATDPVADYLRTVQTSDAVRAMAWDAVHTATDDADLTARLTKLPVPNTVRAQLFELHPQAASQPAPVPAAPNQTMASPDDFTRPLTMMERAARVLAPNVAPVTPQNLDQRLGDVKRADDERRLAGADIAPTAGGLVGGMVGGVPGAAVGGFVGDMAKQAVRRDIGAPSPETVSEQALSGATQGAIQGVSEGAGKVIAAGAGKAGTWLMNRAVNATDRLSREFPDLSKTLIDNAITVSSGGLRKAREMLVSAKAEANASLATADAKGARIPIADVTKALSKTFADAANSADPVGGVRTLVKMARQMTAGRSGSLTMAEADALKRSLQLESKALYRSMTAANGRTPVTLMAQGKADMAAALNEAIEAATTAAGAPGYKAANFAAKDMIGATRAITNAIRPGSNLYQAMVRPGVGAMLGGSAGAAEGHPYAGAVAGAILTSPKTMSAQAIALAHPATQALLKQLPRATAAQFIEWAGQPPSQP